MLFRSPDGVEIRPMKEIVELFEIAEMMLGAVGTAFVPALLAMGFATSFIHYLLDRAAFRFSSPDVRQAGANRFATGVVVDDERHRQHREGKAKRGAQRETDR